MQRSTARALVASDLAEPLTGSPRAPANRSVCSPPSPFLLTSTAAQPSKNGRATAIASMADTHRPQYGTFLSRCGWPTIYFRPVRWQAPSSSLSVARGPNATLSLEPRHDQFRCKTGTALPRGSRLSCTWASRDLWPRPAAPANRDSSQAPSGETSSLPRHRNRFVRTRGSEGLSPRPSWAVAAAKTRCPFARPFGLLNERPRAGNRSAAP